MTEKLTDEPTVYVLPITALAPGDVIVVEWPRKQEISRTEYDQWVAFLRKTFPQQKHILLAGGAQIRVMKPPPSKTAKLGKETTDAGSQRADGQHDEPGSGASPAAAPGASERSGEGGDRDADAGQASRDRNSA